ncbi:MAG TPA: phosphoenolpyruvate--protein phosphotransferase [Steroidobacteraceae bacterium]|nr:phosphoenolpyruvate--protein phosphotransferase [Steroidobacteraceae bacterium]
MILRCPLAGWSSSLDEAPDPVFAGRMLGDGVLVDPTGHELFAPCDGEIISVAPSKHAVSIRSTEGVEVLMHVGIDTVALDGAGFELHVAAGERVSAGTKLLTFDLDFLARNAKSVATPIIVTNTERFEIISAQLDRDLLVGDALIELRAKSLAQDETRGAGERCGATIRVDHEHGIHARPAALIANAAKKLSAQVEISAQGKTANAASAIALMSLGVRAGDDVVITVTGANARKALEAIKGVIRGLEPHEQVSAVAKVPAKPVPTGDPNRVRGVIASRGVAIGSAFHLRRSELSVPERGTSVASERSEFERARNAVKSRLEALAASSHHQARQVIEAHLELVDDPELLAAANEHIEAGRSAGFGWRSAIRTSADTLKSLSDARMAERIDDLLDLEHQVLAALLGEEAAHAIEIPDQSILIAADLQPSQFIALDKSKLVAICLANGGPTSHVAILAAAIGVPMLVALGDRIHDARDQQSIIVDADAGFVLLDPNDEQLASTSARLTARREEMERVRLAAQRECRTADGVRIEVFANLGSLADAKFAVEQGAEGCGLLRTEFLFLDRERAPDEGEQLRCYQDIAAALDSRPLVIRTLDIGGDKPIPYLPLPREENPALGLRGVRTSLWRPDLLRTQLRAILRVQPQGQCRILLPMITELAETRSVVKLIDELRAELSIANRPQIGIMIETPASAVLADQLAREVDFLSIGTNDLTQYALAMDRGHAELAPRIDGLHPAVLRLIAMTCEAASKHERLVAVCGGLASDPAAVSVLLGLGVGELSVVPAMIPQIKQLVAELAIEECRALSERVLLLESAEAVRSAVAERSRHSQRSISHDTKAKWG